MTIELTPERQKARDEYRRRISALMLRAAFSRDPWIPNEPVEEDDFHGEDKNS